MEVGRRIKERRKSLGLSAETVADRIGVSPSTVYRYESSDIMNMGIDKLKLIADALETTPAYLMDWDKESSSDSLKHSRNQFKMKVAPRITVLSKEVFSRNLAQYMERFGKNQKEIAEIVGVSPPTVNDWIKMKKYPRIDKIQVLANYFGILKSDLIEDKSNDSSLSHAINQRDMKDVDQIISNTIELLRQDDLMFNGKLADEEDIQSIISTIEIGLEMAKKRKKKVTTKLI